MGKKRSKSKGTRQMKNNGPKQHLTIPKATKSISKQKKPIESKSKDLKIDKI